jgi:hypothetical protein
MAQTKTNGAPEAGQFLTGNLDHLIIDEVSGTADISDLGTVNGNAEVLLSALSTVSNPVIIESSNARVMFVAVESNGASTADMATAINEATAFSACTVTAGSYSVV